MKSDSFDYAGYVMTIPEEIEQAFIEMYEQYCVDMPINSKKANIIDSFWDEIGDKLLKANNDMIRNNNQKSKILYHDIDTVEEVTKKYINLCTRYGCIPKIESFCNLTKISKDCLYRWHNSNTSNGYIFYVNDTIAEEDYKNIIYIFNNIDDIQKIYANNVYLKDKKGNVNRLSLLRYDCIKKIKDSSQLFTRNALMDSNIGPAAIANNDSEVGLMWDAKRQITAEAIRQNAIPLQAVDLPKLE